jgi:hypothetical protein
MKTRTLLLIIWVLTVFPLCKLSAQNNVNPANFQHNMTITGIIHLENTTTVSGQDTLYAYSVNECRGRITPYYEAEAGKWFAYLIVYSNKTNEEITFKYYSKNKNTVINLISKASFEIDKILGTPAQPYIFTDMATSGIDENLPDPFFTLHHKTLSIQIVEPTRLEIFDVSGKIILIKELEGGINEIDLNGIRENNIYLIRLQGKRSAMTKKIFL